MNNNEAPKTSSRGKLNEIRWNRRIYSLFRRSSAGGRRSRTRNPDVKMGSLLNGDAASPEDVTLTTETVKKKKKSFEIFHWKFMLWSVLFVIGLCGTTIMWFTAIYNEEIFKTLTLGNGTQLHYAWKNPPLEPLLCVRIFNYTNVDEFFSSDNKYDKNIRLKVQEVGPFCFRETIERKVIEFRNNGTRMSYKEQRTHKFDNESSVGSLDDTVFVPNVLILSVYKEIQNISAFSRFGVSTYLNTVGAKPITELSVRKYIFGYEDNAFSTIGTINSVLSSDSKATPKEFGILKKRSGLSNDTFLIGTGNGNLEEMGQVIEINNVSAFTAWSTDACNLVTGSDGLFFRRSAVQSFSDVEIMNKDACRTLPLTFDHVEELKGGIQAYRYKLRPDVFSNNRTENQCFCNVSHTCRIHGALDISSCSFVSGAPIVISRPHFLDSNVNINESGSEIIEGLNPDIEKHDFHMDIFPAIGLTVRTLMRMQLNIQVRNPSSDRNLNPLADRTVLPIAWVEMNSGTEVPAKMFSLLYHLSYTMKWAELALKWTFLLFTLLMAFILFRLSFMKSSKKEFIMISKKSKPSNSVVSNVYVP